MKNLFIITIAAVGMILSVDAFAFSNKDATPEKEVIVSVNDAYIPGGFDSTSDVFVVVNGIFPNGCYRWLRGDVAHPEKNLHEVRSMAKVSQGMCLMVLVPFTREVHVGQIGAGEHKIHFVNGDGTYIEKALNIEE